MVREIPSNDTQQLWQEFGDRLRAFIARRVDSAADAEDILQDVFLRIHQHAGGVHRSERLTSWLFQVTRNAIADYYRAPARRERPESVDSAATHGRFAIAEATDEIDDDPAQVRKELAGCLRPMMERLPPHYREAVTIVDLTGVTQVQAAAQLGLSVSGMKSRVQRGRQTLREILVDCCPVQLDTGGRIVDYEQPSPICATCAAPDEALPRAKGHGASPGRCCGPRIDGGGVLRTPRIGA